MELNQIKQLIDRWEKLEDKFYSTNKFEPNIANVEFYFKKLLETKTFKEVNDILIKIETIDKEFKLECEKRKVKEIYNKVNLDINNKLNETIWSMLSDAPLSQEGKQLYRDYRQYLRDIPDLYKRKQINKLEVMTFDEWRKNPPVYKIEKKVIL